MAKHTIRLICNHPGCTEVAFYGYDTLREMRESSAHRMAHDHSYMCLRHSRPNDVLSEANQTTTHIMTSYQCEYGRFWRQDGTTQSGTGFIAGPGFMAYANDLPVGARIVITATLEMPAAQPAQAGADRAGG